MTKFFKALSAALLALCTGVFTLVVNGMAQVPDELSVMSTDTLELDWPYELCTSQGQAKAAANFEQSGCGSVEHKARVVTLGAVPVKDVAVRVTKRKYVNIGGDVFGIKLYTKGVIAVGIDEVITEGGCVGPAHSAGIKKGDVITHADSVELDSADKLAQLVEQSNGKPLTLRVMRNSESHTAVLTPVRAEDGRYKAGLWVRDSSAGIGTVTFFDSENGIFAGLGHAVCDIDTGEIMPLSQGEAVEASIVGCYPGTSGSPGELCGTFTDKRIGSLLVNSHSGVFGEMLGYTASTAQLPVAIENEVKTGKAQIIATIDKNGPEYYDVEITRIYSAVDSTNRNMVIKVTDSELIDKTGGIVQGMSGSPIIQNSMLVGAVTHVFINDPTQGYAIFADKMLEAIDTNDSLAIKNAS